MKKHLLIGIPITILLVFSVAAISFTIQRLDSYKVISAAAQTVSPTSSQRYLDALASIKSEQDTKQFASEIISSQTQAHASVHKLLTEVTQAAEKDFSILVYVFGGAFLLLCLVAIGLYPRFQKNAPQNAKEE